MLNANQLRWRCRRGVRELDVLFTHFLETEYPQLDDAGKQAFERLLEEQDPIIMDWLFGRAVTSDNGIKPLIQRLQKLSRP